MYPNTTSYIFWPQSTYIGTTLRPMYIILFRYIDPKGLYCMCMSAHAGASNNQSMSVCIGGQDLLGKRVLQLLGHLGFRVCAVYMF